MYLSDLHSWKLPMTKPTLSRKMSTSKLFFLFYSCLNASSLYKIYVVHVTLAGRKCIGNYESEELYFLWLGFLCSCQQFKNEAIKNCHNFTMIYLCIKIFVFPTFHIPSSIESKFGYQKLETICSLWNYVLIHTHTHTHTKWLLWPSAYDWLND